MLYRKCLTYLYLPFGSGNSQRQAIATQIPQSTSAEIVNLYLTGEVQDQQQDQQGEEEEIG